MERSLNILNFSCSVLLLLIGCSFQTIEGDQTCPIIPVEMTRIHCFETFGATELDLYNVSRISFFMCVKHCSEIQQCVSILFDTRQDICEFYRQMPYNSLDENTDIVEKFFLTFQEQDDCITSPEPECYRVINGYAVYAGRKMTTESGITCQRFDQQTPHSHTRTDPANYPETSLAAVGNFCRDPDGEGVPWCYTEDLAVRWTPCGIPICKT